MRLTVEEENEMPAVAAVAAAGPINAGLAALAAFQSNTGQTGTSQMTVEEQCEAEIKSYLSVPELAFVGPNGGHNSPLDWWRMNETAFPRLAKLARLHLAVPATSAPSERIFSRAALTITKKRNRMDPENASRQMFVQSNLPWFEKDYFENAGNADENDNDSDED